MAAKTKPRMIGRHIVADPAVCHGQPTFRGTRILVGDVLEQVSAGMARESIVLEWRDRVSKEAIGEAVRLASQAFQDHADQYVATEYVLQPQRFVIGITGMRRWRPGESGAFPFSKTVFGCVFLSGS